MLYSATGKVEGHHRATAGIMDQETRKPITDTLRRMSLRGPLARFRSHEAQALPPVVALILEFAAFASLPLFFMGYLLLAHGSSSPASLDLHGIWKTDAPGYTDRFMEISEGVILFGTGSDTLESYVIEDVKTEPDGAKTLYTLTYLDKDMVESRLSFYYDPRAERVMTFKHQDHLKWTRVQE